MLLNKTTIFLMLALFLGTVFSGFSKGCNGKYIITGIMYDARTKSPILNQKFIINNQPVFTDSNGRYSITIEYRTTDRYSNFIKAHFENSKINKKTIEFIYNEKKKEIKNRWRKYGLKYCFSPEVYTLNKSFYW